MNNWPKRPVLYEVNTWVWLYELSQRNKEEIHLGNVPNKEWDAIASLSVDAVWLMGVWERSPTGARIATENQGLLTEFRRILPDFKLEDVVGSPYCIRNFEVDAHLGGRQGLETARKELTSRGIHLILDFVPNHVAPDHRWIFEHPEFFIQGGAEDLARMPSAFFEAGGTIFAHGRDPYFPPWPDVAQLNAFHPGLRQAAIETVKGIACHCDGIRCDMAMLFMNSIFERTWGLRAGRRPETEYWDEVIQSTRRSFPDLLFMAEAYWDLEWELQRQGFDFCYDKRLYECLEHGHAEDVRLHLLADLSYQNKLVRFIENHDEPRGASTFRGEKARTAAVTISTVPGAKLFHEGQFEGRKIKHSIFLRRRPDEPVDLELQAFYHRLLKAIDRPGIRDGQWQLCERMGWMDNQTYLNLVAWRYLQEDERYLIVVNLSDQSSQGRIWLTSEEWAGRLWKLTDLFKEEVYERDGNQVSAPGLYIDLGAWSFHFFKCEIK